eukprot:760103-Hanusia_phi.AAC.8
MRLRLPACLPASWPCCLPAEVLLSEAPSAVAPSPAPARPAAVCGIPTPRVQTATILPFQLLQLSSPPSPSSPPQARSPWIAEILLEFDIEPPAMIGQAQKQSDHRAAFLRRPRAAGAAGRFAAPRGWALKL